MLGLYITKELRKLKNGKQTLNSLTKKQLANRGIGVRMLCWEKGTATSFAMRLTKHFQWARILPSFQLFKKEQYGQAHDMLSRPMPKMKQAFMVRLNWPYRLGYTAVKATYSNLRGR